MNGYIQVEINGKPVGLKFNMYATETYSNGVKTGGLSGNIVKMVWAGIIGNAFVKQIEPELTFEDVAEWVEYLTLKGDKEQVLQKISDTFLSSESVKDVIEKSKVAGDDTKKKPRIGKKSMK